MGCVSSKLAKKEIQREILAGSGTGDFANHVVSLKSSTYGALILDKDQQQRSPVTKEAPVPIPPRKSSSRTSPSREEPPEIINAWELMGDLEEGSSSPTAVDPPAPAKKQSPRFDARTPLKFLNQMGSPKNFKKLPGKENSKGRGVTGLNSSPAVKPIVKASSLPPNLRISKKGVSPGDRVVKCNGSLRIDTGVARRSLGPLFVPELEKEQIKKMVTPKTRKPTTSSTAKLESYEKKCPPGGETAVVIYTTTLRGIRKTFEDCNVVRSTIGSHHVQTFERDVSMDLGFKDEIRSLIGKKEVKIPLVFIKGRLIGGAEEIVKLEEEGSLGTLLDGIAKASGWCQGCAGVRFVMCTECNGSCKVIGADGRKKVKCVGCNENGLTQCPICCC